MKGKDLLKGIQNLDAELIEEAEFGAFPKSKPKGFGKKKLLLLLAAVLVLLATLTAATVYTRWSATMQYGNYGGGQPSEQVKKQAEQSGLAVMPTEEQKAISATDNGITVTVVQTLADQYGGRAVFRIDGLDITEGQAPWAWWEFLIDGVPLHQTEYEMGLGAEFFDGVMIDADGKPAYIKNGQPVATEGEYDEWVMDYQLSDGSIEYSIDMDWEKNCLLGKKVTFLFTGFGIQGKKFEDEEIMTHPGQWELSWTMEGSTQAPRKWTPNAKIGDWDVTLVEAEIGQYSMKTVYRLGEQYTDIEDFCNKTSWTPSPASFRLKDGSDITAWGRGTLSWDADTHQYTEVSCAWTTVLDPDQIVGVSFYSGYELNDQGYRVDKPYYYIPLE